MSENRSWKAVATSLFVVVAIVVAAWLWPRESRVDPEAPQNGRPDEAVEPRRAPQPRTSRAAPQRSVVASVVEEAVEGDRPLPDVVVTMHHRGVRESVRSTSDASGRATFLDLSDGAWLAEASAAGHESATAPCAVTDGDFATPVELVLRKRGVVRGVVHDATGAVAAKALVRLHLSAEVNVESALAGAQPSTGTRKAESVTDDYGRYVLPDVGVGTKYVMWVGHPNAGIRSLEVPALRPGEDRTVDVVLERRTTIHGEIPADLLGEGRGLVNLLNRNGKGIDQEDRITVDPEHREYLFQHMRSGEKLLSFTVQNGTRFYAGFQDVSVAEGEHLELGAWRPLDSTLKLRLKPTVEGQSSRGANLMFDATEGAPRWYVNLMHVRVPIGVDFTVQGMRAGELRLTASVMDAAGTLPSSREGCATDEFEFDGKFAERELVLVPAGGVGPKGIMSFRVAPPPGVKADDAMLYWILWSGRDALDCLPRDHRGLVAFNSGVRSAGRYRIEVYGEGYVATKEYDQGDGDADLTLPASAWTRAQSLAGVARSGGDPAPGARIVLSVKNATGEQFVVAETHAASDGTFEFRSLPQTAELSVNATKGDRASRRTSVSGFQSATGLVLDLQK
jgi:hypothetical protein